MVSLSDRAFTVTGFHPECYLPAFYAGNFCHSLYNSTAQAGSGMAYVQLCPNAFKSALPEQEIGRLLHKGGHCRSCVYGKSSRLVGQCRIIFTYGMFYRIFLSGFKFHDSVILAIQPQPQPMLSRPLPFFLLHNFLSSLQYFPIQGNRFPA